MTTTPLAASASPADEALPRSLLGPRRFSPLRAVIKKELRENIKFAVFIVLLLALCVLTSIWYATGAFRDPLNADSILFDNGFLAVSMYAFPAAALVLGLVQIFSERAFDVRSFFVHRAATPTRLFLGKVMAGLLLYFLAIGLPLLFFFAYAAWSPRGGAFFDISFTRPYVADFLVGIPYYFAGILLAQRQARLFGSRLLPLTGAWATSYVALSLHYFSEAVIGILLISVPMALAAWHCYLANGLDPALGQASHDGAAAAGKPFTGAFFKRLGRLSIPVVMVMALTVLLAPTAMGIGRMMELLAYPPPAGQQYVEPADRYTRVESFYQLRPNGEPAIGYERELKRKREQDPQYETWYTDLAGHPLAGRDAPSQARPANRIVTNWWHDLTYTDYHYYRWPDDTLGYAFQSNTLDKPLEKPDARTWFYLRNRRYYVGYDFLRHQPLGTLGATGHLPPGARPEPFPYDIERENERTLVILNGVVYHPVFDSEPARLQPWVTLPPGEKVRQIQITSRSHLPGEGDWGYIRTDTKIYLFRFQTETAATPFMSIPIAYPSDAMYLVISLHPLNHHVTFWYQNPQRSGKISYLFTYDESGHELSRMELPPLPNPPEPAPPAKPAVEPSIAFAVGLVHSAGNPLTIFALDRAETSLNGNSRFAYDRPFPFLRSFSPAYDEEHFPRNYYYAESSTHYYRAGVALSALLSAILVCLLTRRYRFALSGTILWSLATLLLGPVGLLTFLFTQPLPKHVACPNCHRRRLISRNLCEHCSAPFPPAPLTGTEVFVIDPA